MREKESAGQTVRAEAQGRVAERLCHAARIVCLLFILTLALWVLPRLDGVFCSLSPQAQILSVRGVVRAAPEAAPLAHATVYSDRDLHVTGPDGAFRIESRRNAQLTVEAPGYQTAQLCVKDETPLILLLFPEEQVAPRP